MRGRSCLRDVHLGVDRASQGSHDPPSRHRPPGDGLQFRQSWPEEVILHLAPLSFDASTFELWGALLNGGKLVILPAPHPSLDDIAEAIRVNGVTTLWLTAGLFHLMVESRLDGLQPLRQLIVGGDVLSPPHVAKALKALPSLSYRQRLWTHREYDVYLLLHDPTKSRRPRDQFRSDRPFRIRPSMCSMPTGGLSRSARKESSTPAARAWRWAI